MEPDSGKHRLLDILISVCAGYWVLFLLYSLVQFSGRAMSGIVPGYTHMDVGWSFLPGWGAPSVAGFAVRQLILLAITAWLVWLRYGRKPSRK